MKGGRRFSGWVRVVRGSGLDLPTDYYLQYLHALARVFDKQVAQ